MFRLKYRWKEEKKKKKKVWKIMLVKISKRIIGDLIGMKKNKKLDNIVNYQNILNKHVIKVTQSKIKR